MVSVSKTRFLRASFPCFASSLLSASASSPISPSLWLSLISPRIPSLLPTKASKLPLPKQSVNTFRSLLCLTLVPSQATALPFPVHHPSS